MEEPHVTLGQPPHQFRLQPQNQTIRFFPEPTPRSFYNTERNQP